MTRFNALGGRYGMHSGSGRFKNLQVEQNMWLQGSVLGQGCQGTIYYVDKTVTASGDGKSWDHAFKTVTEGLAALSDYDWLIIGPGNYDEADNMAITDLKGAKIFGYGNGMQWGEGSTCIRTVIATTKDILDIRGCQSLEIAGINFIVTTQYDAINVEVGTTAAYSLHIHDCGFIGNPGTAVGLYGIFGAGADMPDLYVHDCRFFGWKTAAISALGQRAVIRNNVFVIPASGIGVEDTNGPSEYNFIADNLFLGGAGASTYGIKLTATQGNQMIANNLFCNFDANKEISTTHGANGILNYQDHTDGTITVVDHAA